MTLRDPNGIPDTVRRALALHQAGRLAEAESLYKSVLRVDKKQFEALHFLGLIEAQRENFEEAHRLMSRSLEVNTRTPDAYANHARVLNALRRPEQALAACQKALALNPRLLAALSSRAVALQDLGRFSEALSSYDKSLEVKGDYAAALAGRGNCLLALGRHDEGLASFSKALAINPADVAALIGRGKAFGLLNRIDEALADCDRALAVAPNNVVALTYRGIALNLLNRHEQGLASLDRALAINRAQPEALFHRGNSLYALHRHHDALESYESALALAPNYVDAISNRGDALARLGRLEEALASYQKAISIDPANANAHHNLGNLMLKMGRRDDAIRHYEAVLAVNPGHRFAYGALLDSVLAVCDWNRAEELIGGVPSKLAQGQSLNGPFPLLACIADPLIHLRCAQNAVRHLNMTAAPRRSVRAGGRRLRIAYLSGDFRRHVNATLATPLFERHDRSRFEVLGVSFGPDDGSDERRRLARAFDEFHDVATRSDREVVELLLNREVDIAIDLMGHTDHSRLGILAGRPAPVQVSYLGFLGTTGAEFIDYILADRIALPFDQQPFYTEKIVHLPDCFLVNDDGLPIAPEAPSRDDCALPAAGFVFCSFNNAYKIQRATFDVWMRILNAVPDSVLWLHQSNDRVVGTLRREAQQRGVDPARLIFAPTVDLPQHLARLRLADLFLDATPYNAGATASGALWAGLPVLTSVGTTFVGRMAASMLHAAGVPSLAVANLQDYEAMAIKLAREPALVASLRETLNRNHATCPPV